MSSMVDGIQTTERRKTFIRSLRKVIKITLANIVRYLVFVRPMTK